MKQIKERCLWFIGANRTQDSPLKDFIYCENDVLLVELNTGWEAEHKPLRYVDGKMRVGVRYTLAKRGIRL